MNRAGLAALIASLPGWCFVPTLLQTWLLMKFGKKKGDCVKLGAISEPIEDTHAV